MWDLYVLLITLIDFDLEIDEIFNSDAPRVFTHNFKLAGCVYITQFHDRRLNATSVLYYVGKNNKISIQLRNNNSYDIFYRTIKI